MPPAQYNGGKRNLVMVIALKNVVSKMQQPHFFFPETASTNTWSPGFIGFFSLVEGSSSETQIDYC